MNKKVLIVAPSFPIPETGAEQADRAAGIRQFVRLGYHVSVITKVVAWADHARIKAVGEELGIMITTVPYRYSNRVRSFKEKVIHTLGRLRNPLFFDGAAYEYAEPGIQSALVQALDTFKPDVVWFEYTYLWPLYGHVRARGIPIVTRSHNFEPEHFLEEDGRTFGNYLKYLVKLLGERITSRWSNVVLAITPKEKDRYLKLGAKQVDILPLRSLSPLVLLPRPQTTDHAPLHVVFMGSSYSVAHNREAVTFLIRKIVPQVTKRAPDSFVFHIVGAKLPDSLMHEANEQGCVYDGYVDDLNVFLQKMDIALVPSLSGAGMQQKIFEPITRGIPTITSPRGLAGYTLINGEHCLTATTVSEYVEKLMELRNLEKRTAISSAASHQAAALFSQQVLDAIVGNTIKSILK